MLSISKALTYTMQTSSKVLCTQMSETPPPARIRLGQARTQELGTSALGVPVRERRHNAASWALNRSEGMLWRNMQAGASYVLARGLRGSTAVGTRALASAAQGVSFDCVQGESHSFTSHWALVCRQQEPKQFFAACVLERLPVLFCMSPRCVASVQINMDVHVFTECQRRSSYLNKNHSYVSTSL